MKIGGIVIRNKRLQRITNIVYQKNFAVVQYESLFSGVQSQETVKLKE